MTLETIPNQAMFIRFAGLYLHQPYAFSTYVCVNISVLMYVQASNQMFSIGIYIYPN